MVRVRVRVRTRGGDALRVRTRGGDALWHALVTDGGAAARE